MNPEFNVEDIRRQFPVLAATVNGKRLAWLDTASTALKPECVLEATTDYYRRCPANIHRSVHSLGETATALYENSREIVRRFINAGDSSEVIFTDGTTGSINLVAASAGQAWFSAGDEVLISELEHHSNIVPWQLLRDRAGIRLRVIPVNDSGDITPDALRRQLSPRTRLVALTAISNAIGTQLALPDLIPIAHAAGAYVLVDAAQAAASVPIDVQALDCDFLAFSGHKLFGPTGIGILYGKKALLEAMPPYKGGGDMIRSVSLEETVYNDLPYKFEAGTANIAGAIGLGRAIEFISAIGFDAIGRHETRLVAAALQALAAIPEVTLIGTPAVRRNIISFVINGIHPHDAGTLLDEDGIAVRAGHHCAQPLMRRFGVPATVRVSFSIYNNMDDIEQLTASIKRIIRVFA
jgi:cysteine desulfurase/selenocysteine lyase